MVVTTREPIIARSVSFFWYRRVYIGTKFARLPKGQQTAVILHERGHIEKHHTEARLLSVLFPFKPFIRWLCHRQEYAADRYVLEHGFGRELVDFLVANGARESFTHPSDYARACRLQKMLYDARTSTDDRKSSNHVDEQSDTTARSA